MGYDYHKERNFAENNPGIPPEMRKYFQGVNEALVAGDLWVTTTTSTTTSTSSTTTTSSSSTTTTTA